MIYVTGDTHGLNDFDKLVKLTSLKLTRKDILFILGDAGICWNYSDLKLMDFIYSSLGCKVFFIDGNHENFDMLEQFPIVTKYGAKVHQIGKYIFHIIRGEILNINNLKILCIGGAYSIDYWQRVEGFSWWPEEEITKKDIENATNNLAKYDNKVDYIFTHCIDGNSLWKAFHFKGDESTKRLSIIENTATYNHWLFGHYHVDKEITNKKCCIYKRIYKINKDGEMEKISYGN